MKNLVTEHLWCVKHVNIFRDLTEADAHALAQITTFKNQKHEEIICTEGVYLIKEGRVKIADNSPDIESEKPQTTADNKDSDVKKDAKEVLEQGEMFGVVPNDDRFLDGNLYSFAETISDVCLGLVKIRDFSFFLKRKPHLVLPLKRRIPNVFKKVHDTFSAANNKNENWHFGSSNILIRNTTLDNLRTNSFVNIAFRCTSSRLALLLQNLADTPDSKGVVLGPLLTTNRISKLIGSSIETIESLLKTFEQHNVIKKRRGRFQILNPWQLKKIADARMKTLLPFPVSEATSEDAFELDFLANLSNEGNNQTGSKVSSV